MTSLNKTLINWAATWGVFVASSGVAGNAFDDLERLIKQREEKRIQYLREQGFTQAANSLQGYVYKEKMKQNV